MFTLNCRGKLICAEGPLVMGIINATSDSFYRGYLNATRENILALASRMIGEGADILDIGGESTRPGSAPISADEELSRVIPLIEMLHAQFPAMVISVDTYRHQTAEAAVIAGASMVNDISGGGADERMLATVAALRVPYVCMHMKGTPQTMQRHAAYENITAELFNYFSERTQACRTAGITDIILDPGFGFAKDAAQNFSLLNSLGIFKTLGFPLLVGLSRKSTIYKTLGIGAADALNGTTVLNTIALNNGADILRVHDVREAREAVTLVSRYRSARIRGA